MQKWLRRHLVWATVEQACDLKPLHWWQRCFRWAGLSVLLVAGSSFGQPLEPISMVDVSERGETELEDEALYAPGRDSGVDAECDEPSLMMRAEGESVPLTQVAYLDGVIGCYGSWLALPENERGMPPLSSDQDGDAFCCMATVNSITDTLLGWRAMHPEQLIAWGEPVEEWRHASGWGPAIAYRSCGTSCCDTKTLIEELETYGYSFFMEYTDPFGNYVDLRDNDDSRNLMQHDWRNDVPEWFRAEISRRGHYYAPGAIVRYETEEWTIQRVCEVFAAGGAIETKGYKTGDGSPFERRSISSHIQALVAIDGSPQTRAWVKDVWGEELAPDDMVAWFDQSYDEAVDGNWTGELSAKDWPAHYPIPRWPGVWAWRLSDALEWLTFRRAFYPRMVGFAAPEPEPEPETGDSVIRLAISQTEMSPFRGSTVVSVFRSKPEDFPSEVVLRCVGNATEGEHYTISGKVLTIPAGQRRADALIVPTGKTWWLAHSATVRIEDVANGHPVGSDRVQFQIKKYGK